MEAACHFETLAHIYSVPPILVPTRAGLSSPQSCSVIFAPITVLFGLVWSGRTFVPVFNSEFLSLYNILCSLLYPFYIIHFFTLPVSAFSLCIFLSGTLSTLCISLSGTLSSLCIISSGTASCLFISVLGTLSYLCTSLSSTPFFFLSVIPFIISLFHHNSGWRYFETDFFCVPNYMYVMYVNIVQHRAATRVSTSEHIDGKQCYSITYIHTLNGLMRSLQIVPLRRCLRKQSGLG